MEVLDDDLEILTEIGKGCWSVVRQGYIKSTRLPVAVKVETIEGESSSLLLREAKIMKHLQGIDGIPTLYKSGSTSSFNYIAMQKLHCTLDLLRKQGLLKSDDVLARADQLLTTMELMHKRGIIHQDLQPKNLMTSDDYSKTYYIDFGLATSISNQSVKGPRTVGILGTPSFSSLSALLGVEQDRKDDLESLGYNIVWLICGKLPWESYAKEGSLSNLKSAKFHTPVSLVCQGCPDELVHYFNYVKGLQFRDMPDYQFLKGLLECARNRLQQITQVPMSFSPKPRARHMSEDITLMFKGTENSRKVLAGFAGLNHNQSISRKPTLTGGSKMSKRKKRPPRINIYNDSQSTRTDIDMSALSPMAKSLGPQNIPKFSPSEEHGEDSPNFGLQRKMTQVHESSEDNDRQVRRKSTLGRSKKREPSLAIARVPTMNRSKTMKQSLAEIKYKRDDSQATTTSSPAQAEIVKSDSFDRSHTMTGPKFPNLNPKTRATIAELKSSAAEKPSQCLLY
mmetsp:Transcript_4150/g.8369  ORF Transcript_4150/g.8369 Transcript_4150/m.8369 type:complete len:509 (-) Transcript_4150:384-1910(-)